MVTRVSGTVASIQVNAGAACVAQFEHVNSNNLMTIEERRVVPIQMKIFVTGVLLRNLYLCTKILIR
jgi:hypothetical protein